MDWHNLQATPRHKTFISFYHTDEYYKSHLESQWAGQFDGFVSQSVGDGDIAPNLPTDRIRQIIRDDFISDATVTIVLIGVGTWRRKHVDWEIGSSIRSTKNNSRTGLLGILLPSYSAQTLPGTSYLDFKNAENGGQYNPYTIPPRLHDNIECGYAKIYSWPSSSTELKGWLHEAYQKRKIGTPDNSYPGFSNNRRDSQLHWRS